MLTVLCCCAALFQHGGMCRVLGGRQACLTLSLRSKCSWMGRKSVLLEGLVHMSTNKTNNVSFVLWISLNPFPNGYINERGCELMVTSFGNCTSLNVTLVFKCGLHARHFPLKLEEGHGSHLDLGWWETWQGRSPKSPQMMLKTADKKWIIVCPAFRYSHLGVAFQTERSWNVL